MRVAFQDYIRWSISGCILELQIRKKPMPQLYTCVCMHVRVCMYVCMHVRVSVHVCVHVRTCACAFEYTRLVAKLSCPPGDYDRA